MTAYATSECAIHELSCTRFCFVVLVVYRRSYNQIACTRSKKDPDTFFRYNMREFRHHETIGARSSIEE